MMGLWMLYCHYHHLIVLLVFMIGIAIGVVITNNQNTKKNQAILIEAGVGKYETDKYGKTKFIFFDRALPSSIKGNP